MPIPEPEDFLGEIDMSDSLADRLETLIIHYKGSIFVGGKIICTEFAGIVDEVRALEAENARYKYTPEAYDEMWARVKEAVNENDELKAQLEDCTAVNAEVMKKVARLEKSINNQETDSN